MIWHSFLQPRWMMKTSRHSSWSDALSATCVLMAHSSHFVFSLLRHMIEPAIWSKYVCQNIVIGTSLILSRRTWFLPTWSPGNLFSIAHSALLLAMCIYSEQAYIPVDHLASTMSLHGTASWYVYVLFEDNRIHTSFCFGFGHNVRVIFSNAKDEAWSWNKHLNDQ